MHIDRFLIDPLFLFFSQFVSLIDEMISECGSEFERLAKELAESRERSSQLEGKLKVIEKGDFDLILAGLKSECILTPCLGELGGQVPIAEDSRDGAFPSPEGVTGEGEAPRMIEFAVSYETLFLLFLFCSGQVWTCFYLGTGRLWL